MRKPKFGRENSVENCATREQWFKHTFLPELESRLIAGGISASFRIVGSVADGTAGDESDIDVYVTREQSGTVEYGLIFPAIRQIAHEMFEEGYNSFKVHLWNSIDIPLQAQNLFH